MSSSASSGLWPRLLPLLAATALLVLVYDWRRPMDIYLWSAEQFAAGAFGPEFYDDEAAMDALEQATAGRTREPFGPNPPVMPVFFLPLASLPETAQTPAWALSNLAALVLTLAMLLARLKHLRRQPLAATLLVALLVLSAPLAQNMKASQVYLWVLAQFTFIFYSLSPAGERPAWAWLAGLGLAVALCFKLVGWPVWLLLLARRDWRVLARAATITGGLVLVALPWASLDTWLYYAFVELPRRVSSPVSALAAYQSLSGFWQHLFRYDPRWNPAPLFNAPEVGYLLGLTLSLALLGVTLAASRRAPMQPAVALAVMAALVLSPASDQYHYLLAWIVFAVLLDAWLARRSLWLALALLLAAVMIMLPLPYRSPRVQAGLMALLAYPRLYGGLLLWLSTLMLMPGLPERMLAFVSSGRRAIRAPQT